MKKTTLFALFLTLLLSFAAGCGGDGGGEGSGATHPGGNTAQDFDIAAILSGAGDSAFIGGFDETAKQAFINEAKAEGYDAIFGADGSVRMENKSTGDVIIQMPDGSWSFESGDGERADVSFDNKWPDNEFTKKVPKPEFTVSFSGVTSNKEFSAMFLDANVEAMRAYVEQAKAKGFTINETTTDQEIMGTFLFVFSAEDAEGWSLSVVSISDGQYSLTIIAP